MVSDDQKCPDRFATRWNRVVGIGNFQRAGLEDFIIGQRLTVDSISVLETAAIFNDKLGNISKLAVIGCLCPDSLHHGGKKEEMQR